MNRRERFLVFDDYFFSFGESGIAKLWTKFWSIASSNSLFQERGIKPYLLDRSGRLTNYFNDGEPFWKSPDSFSALRQDTRTITMVMQRLGENSSFLSSYYTFPLFFPSYLLTYDLIPEVLFPTDGSPGWMRRRLAVQAASSFACISENTKSDLVSHYPSVSEVRSASVIYPGVDPDRFFRCSGGACNCDVPEPWLSAVVDPDIPFLLYTGGGASYKNFDLFLDAIDLMKSVPPRIVITALEFRQDVVERFALKGIAVFFVSPGESAYAYLIRHCLFLAYPTKYEGFGLPVAEALASGRHVVLSTGSSLDEFDSPLLRRFDGNSSEDLAAAMDEVLLKALLRADRHAPVSPEETPSDTVRDWSNFALEMADWLAIPASLSAGASGRHLLIERYLDEVVYLPN
jgi:glycosyltransferase involved in cell wall biosynthesis